MAEPQPPDLPALIADLRGIGVANLAEVQGDGALEATIARLRAEAEQRQEAVSGFSSAI